MPIAVSCDGCEKQYQVKDEMAGKKIRCPQCSEIITVGTRRADGIVVLDDDEEVDDDYHEPRALPEPRRRRRRERTERRSRSSSGGNSKIPWGWILGGLGGVALLAVMIALIVFPPAAMIFATGFIVVGMLLNVAGGIGCLVKAFQEDVVCGLLYLFVPFYGLYYLFTRWDEVQPFGGCLLGGLGLELTGFAVMVVGATLLQARSTSNSFANPANPSLPIRNPMIPVTNPPNFPERFPQTSPQQVFPQPVPNVAPPAFTPPQPPNLPQQDTRPQVRLSEGEANIKTRTTPADHTFAAGDTVYLHWGSAWYECEVLEVNAAGMPKVHWIGWSSSWDEFVTPDKIRIPRPK